MLNGTIYVVYEHHYMGMDGDHKTSLFAYTAEKAAKRKVDKLSVRCDHNQGAYDTVWYDYEELHLVC